MPILLDLVYILGMNKYHTSIAKKLKALNKNVKIIFGGPQVPNNAEKFLRNHKFIDYVVHGEGEKGFFRFS